MMGTLESMRAKYGFAGGSYEPNPACKFCRGAGERMTRGGMRFCICLFVAPELSDFAGDSLSATAKKLREEMEQRPHA